MTKSLNLKVSEINVSKLSNYAICRWAALQEAMEIIGDKCDDRHLNFDTIELKPLEILKYIDNAADVIYQKNFPNNSISLYKEELEPVFQ